MFAFFGFSRYKRRIAYNPMIKGRIINFNSFSLHNGFKITIRNTIMDIEKYSLENVIFLENGHL